MRRLLTFPCDGARLAATLDEGPGKSGLLIVSGGNEIRIGAHRGMARLAADIAAAGYPVFRFDRRGIGDSEGENGGFASSGPDIAAAVSAFRNECPALTRIVAFGNCDAASALVIHKVDGIDALVLANPWVIETSDELPGPAAIKARYRERLREPGAWRDLLSGAIDLRKLARGLIRIAAPQPASSLAQQVAGGMSAFRGSVTLLLAARDGTAIAFDDQWKRPVFANVRARGDIRVATLDSASHSFAGDEDYNLLKKFILEALA